MVLKNFFLLYASIVFLLTIMAHPCDILAKEYGVLSGQVLNANTGQPLEGANVVLQNIGGTSTDKSGNFAINRIPVGTYIFQVSFMGFDRFEQKVQIRVGAPVIMVIKLNPIVIPLDSVQVVAQHDNFERKLIQTGPSGFRITPGQIQYLPIPIEPDLVRALSYFPGVTQANEIIGQINVRGGSFDQNLVLVDGIPLYNPFHWFALGSTFNVDAFEEGYFSTGGFPAGYGERLSSVLAVKSRKGSDSLHTKLNLSMTNASIVNRGCYNKHIYWLLAVRRTHLDGLAGLANYTMPYYFYDVHGSISVKMNKVNKIGFTFFKSQDRFQRDDVDEVRWFAAGQPGSNYHFRDEWLLKSRNNAVGLEWLSQIRPGLQSRLFAYQSVAANGFTDRATAKKLADTSSKYSAMIDSMNAYYRTCDEHADNSFLERAIGFDLVWHPHRKLALHVGYQISEFNFAYGWNKNTQRLDLEFNFFDQAPADAFSYHNRLRTRAGSVEILAELSSLFSFRQGVRITKWCNDSNDYIQPRTGLELNIKPFLTFSCALGRYVQGIATARERGILAYMDLYFPAINPAEQAFHYILGAHYHPENNISISIETYYKSFKDLLLSTGPKPDFARINGSGYGMELSTKLAVSWIQLQAFYAFAQNYRIHHGFKYPPNYDQRHRFNFIGSISLGKNWQLNGLWLFHTGQPYDPGFYTTTIRDVSLDAATGEPVYRFFQNIESTAARGSIRYPCYHRLDLEIRKVFHLKKSQIIPFINFYNVYFRKNLLYLSKSRYYETGSSGKLAPVNEEFPAGEFLPVIPTLGVAIEF